MADEPAVDKDGGVAERTVQLQPEPPAGVGRRQIKRAPVPADAVLRERFAQRFRAMGGIALRVERQLDGPIVRQVDPAPTGVAVDHARRPDARARLGQVLTDAPLVAEMELPAEIQQEPFARAGIGGCSGGRKGAHRENEHKGKDVALETFHGRKRSDRVFAGRARGSGDENGGG